MNPAQLMLRDSRLTFPMTEAEKLAASIRPSPGNTPALQPHIAAPVAENRLMGRQAATGDERARRAGLKPRSGPAPAPAGSPGPALPPIGGAPAPAASASAAAPAAAPKTEGSVAGALAEGAANAGKAVAEGAKGAVDKVKGHLKTTEANRTEAGNRAIQSMPEGSMSRSIAETALPHMLRAGPVSWARTGAALGALKGAIDPGTDEEGHRRGVLSGAIHGAGKGMIIGGAGGMAAKHIGNRMIAPHLADIHAGRAPAVVPGSNPTPGVNAPAPSTGHPAALPEMPAGAGLAGQESATIDPITGKYKKAGLLALLQPRMKVSAVYNVGNGNIGITRRDMAPAGPRVAPPIVRPTAPVQAEPTIVPGRPQATAPTAAPLTSAPVVNNTLPPAPASPQVFRKNIPQLKGVRAPAGPALQPR